MLGFVRNRMDAFFGRNQYSTSVPSMDGPWHPNELLETAEVRFRLEDLDNLCAAPDGLYCSSGSTVYRVSDTGPLPAHEMSAPVTCLAAAADGTLAVGLEGNGIELVGGSHHGKTFGELACPTDAVFTDATTLVVTVGSDSRLPSDWKHDLVGKGRSGSVWRIDVVSGKSACLASGLAWPAGVAVKEDGTLVVSEAWKCRLVTIPAEGGTPTEALADLSAYPCRIRRMASGDFLLSLFAPRNQLLEFILQENRFRKRMMNEIDPEHWMAPSLRSRQPFLDPLQGAGVIQMGILKPWSPARSYGLVAHLSPELVPAFSWHSRANGQMHGTTSVAQWNGALLVGARGGGAALVLPAEEGDMFA